MPQLLYSSHKFLKKVGNEFNETTIDIFKHATLLKIIIHNINEEKWKPYCAQHEPIKKLHVTYLKNRNNNQHRKTL